MSTVELQVIPAPKAIMLDDLLVHVQNNDVAAATLGDQLIKLLQLKRKGNQRVDTSWGDKTNIGLARTIIRLLEDNAIELRDNGTL